MTTTASTQNFAAELQGLREVIPHAEAVGASQTNISIELLAALLALHDAALVAATPGSVTISRENVEHLLHARRELQRPEQSPQRFRHALAHQITNMLAPVLSRKAPQGEQACA